jgi:hypothetical protein
MRTGEVKEHIKQAKYNNLDIQIIHDKFINLKGSLHKYFNSANHNHNDFTLIDSFNTIKDLCQRFAINPFNTVLHNLEFGVNVNLPFETKVFLDSIIRYKSKDYELEQFNGRGYLLRFSFDQYELKIYDKGLQYLLKDNTLRFELKVRKMHYLESKGININNYVDLFHAGNIEKLKQLLLNAFNDLLIYDSSINLKTIKSKREREILTSGSNPKYWANLKLMNTNTYKKKRRQFRELVELYSNLKVTVGKIIRDKLDYITTLDESTIQSINDLSEHKAFKTVPNLTTETTSALKLNHTHYNSSSIWLNQYLFSKHRTFGRFELIN